MHFIALPEDIVLVKKLTAILAVLNRADLRDARYRFGTRMSHNVPRRQLEERAREIAAYLHSNAVFPPTA
jgi:hypothetical protein